MGIHHGEISLKIEAFMGKSSRNFRGISSMENSIAMSLMTRGNIQMFGLMGMIPMDDSIIETHSGWWLSLPL